MDKGLKGLWVVMDGRARYDPADATVLEAIGEGVLGQPPRRSCRFWRGHDATLCFCKKIDAKNVAAPIYVEDVG